MDELYLQQVLEGNPDAFRYFVQQYKDMGYAVALSVLKDPFLAEEALQTGFIKAYRNLAYFRKQSKFSTWFLRIVTNEALGQLRKNNHRNIQFTESFPEISVDENAIKQLQQEDKMRLIQEALQQLPPKESLALRLFYLEEEDLNTVCDITGWTMTNTKVILHRARKHILVLLTCSIQQEENLLLYAANRKEH